MSQSEALCGGAAAAMVLRYWGADRIYAEEFQPLVDRSAGGIRAGDLVEAIRRRGWQAEPFQGSRADLHRHLSLGRPLIALIEESPGSYHYVVVVGGAAGGVVVHDPARGPFLALGDEELDRSWGATDYWTLLILPREKEGGRKEPDESDSRPERPAPEECSALVREGVRLAREGNLVEAETTLQAAEILCPRWAAPLRERAGIRLLQSDWAEAARLAERALRLSPDDAYAWRLLATSRFLQDDREGALRAWNHLGEPRVDLTRIDGLTRTRFAVVEDLLALPPQAILTDEALRRAERRLSDLPVQMSSRIGYRPLGNGQAQVEVALVERSLFLNGPLEVAGSALRAFAEREVAAKLASPTGGGELWMAKWRWWEERPRLALTLAVPRPWGLAGVWRVEGLWETESYGVRETEFHSGATRSKDRATIREATIREERRRAGLAVSDWASADFRWELGAALDHWEGRGHHFSLGGSLEKRLVRDGLALRAEAGGWASLEGNTSFASGSFQSNWRSSKRTDGLLWTARAGLLAATREAPLALWPGAGLGHARPPLLRAHPLLSGGIIGGKAFGRLLAHGGVELERWPARIGPVQIGFAGFVDSAKTWKPFSGESGLPTQADVGAGLRIRVAGQEGGLRMDAARGLRDGDWAVSVGWQLPWPGWN